MTRPRFNGATASKVRDLVKHSPCQEYILARVEIAKRSLGGAAADGVFGDESSQNDSRYGELPRQESPRKTFDQTNKPPQKWRLWRAGKFCGFRQRLAQANRCDAIIADLAPRATRYLQSLGHSSPTVRGRSWRGALIAAVGAECVQRHAQLGHLDPQRCGGISGSIRSFSILSFTSMRRPIHRIRFW